MLREKVAFALEWLEGLPPPVIAAPRAHRGERINLFVPNNDADTVEDPRDVSSIRTKKVVNPTMFEDSVPFIYVWSLPGESSPANVLVEAANDLYQLGRGVDMAWAVGELIDDEAVENRLREHRGTVHRPELGASGKALACPAPGSLASLVQRHRSTRLRVEGAGKSASFLFTNAPKPRFASITYERARHRVVYELRDRQDDTKTWPWRLHRVVELITALRDGAAERLREAFPSEHAAIERMLIGRKADGSDPSPMEQRARIIPLPSIGHEHADRDIRRILLDMPSGAPLGAADVEWAFSGLEATEEVGPFVLTRAEADDMLRHYGGPARRWRSVTAVALPESAKRRRIEPTRRREEAKSASARIAEEDRAVAAVHVALRHAGVRGTAIGARVQREPFEARGARVESFAEGTRFAKERLWHVELELDRPVEGPLVIGDGRFLGLGVMAPVTEPWTPKERVKRVDRRAPVIAPPANRSGLFGLAVEGDAKDDSVALARALRRAVMACAQAELGAAPPGRFFSGHEESGAKARADHATHLSFQWDPARRRLLVISPHWLDRREPSWEERRRIEILDRALAKLLELRAGSAGRFALRLQSIATEDPLLVVARSWTSVTPYAVTRHENALASEVLVEDMIVECYRRGLPRPAVTVLEARGVPGRGLEGRVRLDFAVAVSGPIILGRTRYLGGGLFAPSAR
jgi:CRISPR-associated protein Csb2